MHDSCETIKQTPEPTACPSIKQASIKALIDELMLRGGVEVWSIDEDDSYSLRIARMSFKSFSTRKDVGPTRILIINDQEERIYGRSYNST